MPGKIPVISKIYNGETKRIFYLHLKKVTDEYALLYSEAPVQFTERDQVVDLPWAADVYMFFDLWFNAFVFYKKEKGGIDVFCNIATPAKLENNEIHFIDLDLDVIVSKERVITLEDEEEFQVNKKKYAYPSEVQNNAWKAVEIIRERVSQKEIPFHWR